MFHNNYSFGAYRTLCKELAATAAMVNSEKLALQLSEAIQAIEKLITIAAEKEKHLTRRAQASYANLRSFALALVASSGTQQLTHTNGCTDDNPKGWATDCPRCLALHLARDSSRPLAECPTPDYLLPRQRRPKKQSTELTAQPA